jgi:hypothetical protein
MNLIARETETMAVIVTTIRVTGTAARTRDVPFDDPTVTHLELGRGRFGGLIQWSVRSSYTESPDIVYSIECGWWKWEVDLEVGYRLLQCSRI